LRPSPSFALLLLLSVACGSDDDEPAHSVDAPSDVAASEHVAEAIPRTLDRGEGCLVELVRDGSGRELAAGDEVVFAFDARVCGADAPFASTREALEPCTARLDPAGKPALIPGLVRGLIGLKVGTKARIEIPSELAYGKEGLPGAGVPADATLVFDVEVLGAR
jgi:FKBP-type peptidyl-prolyl cis-trans isomerase